MAIKKTISSIYTPQVHIVTIHTGEFDDRCSANLKAFLDKRKALRYRKKAEADLAKMGCLNTCPKGWPKTQYQYEGFHIDYTGAWVSMEQVGLCDNEQRPSKKNS